MRILGYDSGALAFRTLLGHGADPLTAGLPHGYATVGPLDARRAGDGQLELDLSVTRAGQAKPAPNGPPPVDPELDLEELARNGEHPVTRQRVAGYGLITSDHGLLVTEYSHRTNSAGDWGLPGGGIKDDEQPAEAVVREAFEETGQRVEVDEMIVVHSSQWIGRSPHGRLEDFHAIRLVFRARCVDPGEPVVHDVDGTTSDARWIPLTDCTKLPWRRGWDRLIPALLGVATG
ncbi:NUDIX hydrolase [Microlunatus sp. GCM10028923]|uniref:NUDIX hydrolase n=1 Tax=Microlunatus sp. GCM10028923 TaxID=3273400 RepID=UPI00360890D0